MTRSDFYISAEFGAGSEDQERQVYYGKLLKVLRYNFKIGLHEETRALVLVSWVDGLQVNSVRQVLKPVPLSRAFGRATVEDAYTVLNLIGVVEHVRPGRAGKSTFFVDPDRGVHNLLDDTSKSPDGVNRKLRGLM